MMNWTKALCVLLTEVKAKGLSGGAMPDPWDEELFNLISEAMTLRNERGMAKRDELILSVLIVLHEAVQGQLHLEALAHLCVDFHGRWIIEEGLVKVPEGPVLIKTPGGR